MNKTPNQKGLKSWKKGETGNPNGRPKKLPQLDVLLAEVLGSETRGKTEAQHIIEAIKRKAKKGDVRAAEMLFDRGFGKVVQAMEFKGASFEATVFVLPNGREVQI